MTPADPRLIVALDLADVDHARAMVTRLGDAVCSYKIGYALLYEHDAAGLIDQLLRAGHRLFLDCKMFDIPETVRHGVASVARRGAHMVTVHGDPAMLAAAVDAARATALEVFAVTVLTSQDDAALAAMGTPRRVAELVPLRARAAARAGAAGVIASASDDLAPLKALGLKVATPGIRLPGGPAHDQRRVATPAAAIAAGADYLVVGRPITASPDPAATARQITALMAASA